MEADTMTQKAKQLWRELQEQGIVDYSTEGLVEGNIWISAHERAYLLADLPDMHLRNIIEKLMKKGIVVPTEILIERKKRNEATV